MSTSEEKEGFDSEEEELFVPPPSAWFEHQSPPIVASALVPIESDVAMENDEQTSPPLVVGVDHKAAPSSNAPLTDTSGVLHPVPVNPTQFAPQEAVGNTHPSPSWTELSSQVLPAAARELLSSSWRRIYHTARLSYAKGMWQRKYSDLGQNAAGIHLSSHDAANLPFSESQLPPMSSLSWVDRQLVMEWRTYLPTSDGLEEPSEHEDADEDSDFDRARALVPNPFPRPTWRKTEVCHQCHKPFGPTRLRHHCRMCGYSFCQSHSSSSHSLPHFGYDPEVPERVCDQCKQSLLDQNLAERVAWRLARCRDYSEGNLTPYFEIGLDTASQVALRITKAAIAMAKTIPLGAQATVAVETVDVLRKYGLHGIYGIMLRQEFLAAADLLRKALGINKTSWPLSVHELSAAIFYALAQHRAMRGLNPEREEIIHTLRATSEKNSSNDGRTGAATWTQTTPIRASNAERRTVPAVIDNLAESALSFQNNPVLDQTDIYNPDVSTIEQLNETFDPPVNDPRKVEPGTQDPADKLNFTPVCDQVPDSILTSLIFYAPIALNFIYATKEVDMQLLAGQQGWRLLYAFLDQDRNHEQVADRPASAMFLHQEYKIACLSIRGTASINDVVTDIRQLPVPFPEQETDDSESPIRDEDWMDIFSGQGLALCGMASAAFTLFREHIDTLVYFARQGYRIRLTGHSLGGGVATMIGILTLRHFQKLKDLAPLLLPETDEQSFLRVYSYGTPSCVDANIADSVDPFVTTVVLHDDVFPRLTPTSCRGLLKHLLHIRETWVKIHMEDDLRAVGERAKSVWAPKFRQSFALQPTPSSLQKYCEKQYQQGKKKLKFVTQKMSGLEKAHNVASGEPESGVGGGTNSLNKDSNDWGEKFFVPTSDMKQTLEPSTENLDDNDIQKEEGKDNNQPLLLEFLGGAFRQDDGLVIDGDEFFDTEDDLLERDDDDETVATMQFHDALKGIPENLLPGLNDSWTIETGPSDSPRAEDSAGPGSNDPPEAAPVVLEETPLPRMFVPGKVVHIYSWRGVYKAAYVPRTFRELRRLSLAGNMLSNHSTKSYYEGLLEVQTARLAPEIPPKWSAFDEDDTCCCCASRFTWASTLRSEAQEARDKHNCRSCGGLVCDPCAKHRVPIPSIGLTVPVRVCDRCYNDMGGHSHASSSMTSSFLAIDEDEQHFREDALSPDGTRTNGPEECENQEEGRPERRRERRSLVIDELASRMRSSALATCS